MAEEKILIRKASPADLDAIVLLYENFMFDSYLLGFGRVFLREYMKAILESPDTVTLVAIEDKIEGFIVGTLESVKMLRKLFFRVFIRFHWIRKIMIAPNFVFESLGLLFYSRHTQLKNTDAELLFIAVEPALRRKGVASKLILATVSLMAEKGIKNVKVSVQSNNTAVSSLLEKLGFKVKRSFTLFKKEMLLYAFELSQR